MLMVSACSPGVAGEEAGDRWHRLLAAHAAVIEGCERVVLSRARTDPMAAATERPPAALLEAAGFQKFEGRPLDLSEEEVRRVRDLLRNEKHYSWSTVSPAVSRLPPVFLILRRGEDARVVGIDLEHSTLSVSAGTPALASVRLTLSETGVSSWRAFLDGLLPKMR